MGGLVSRLDGRRTGAVAGAFRGARAICQCGARSLLLRVFGLAFLWSLWPLRLLRWPDDKSALRRIELRSQLKNRPATTWLDKQADPLADPASRSIWIVHKRRMAEQLKALKAGWPRSGLPARDPFALRTIMVLCLIVAGVLNWGQWDQRLSEAVSDAPVVAGVEDVGLDAWITPPAYTGKPPVLLSGAAAQARLEKSNELLVPQGSVLVVRLNGATEPTLRVGSPDETDNARNPHHPVWRCRLPKARRCMKSGERSVRRSRSVWLTGERLWPSGA